MKFNQFIKHFNLTATKYGLGFYVYGPMRIEAREAIFRLTDYKVSSHGCSQYFVVPNQNKS